MLDLLAALGRLVARLIAPTLELGLWQVLLWWAIFNAGFGAAWVIAGEQERNLWTDRRVAWWLWHWYSGGLLDTTRNPEHQGPLVVYLRRRLLTAAARTLGSVGFVLAVYLRSGAPSGTGPATLALWGLAGVAALTATTIVAAYVAVRAALYLWWVEPLAEALMVKGVAGWPEGAIKPRRWVHIPRLWEWHRLGVRITFGPGFNVRQTNLDAVVDVVTTKGAFEDAEPTWLLKGRYRTVVFRPAKRIPDLVPFTDSDVRALMEEPIRASRPLLGLSKDGAQVAKDLDSDSPHVIVAAPTNGGKSSILRTVAAQLLYHGARVAVLDLKLHSHMWGRDVPGVVFAPSPYGEPGTGPPPEQAINDLLVRVGEEAERRNLACNTLRAGDPFPPFQRIALVCDELNGTADALSAWWSRQRQRGPCPGVIALRRILFMGRAVRIHVLGGAQQPSARALGGGEARENFALRILIGTYSTSTWKMAASHLDFIAPSDHPGRATVIWGSGATPTQLAYITELDTYNWLTARSLPAAPIPALPAADPQDHHSPPPAFREAVEVAPVVYQGPGLPQAERSEGAPSVDALPLVTLREAVERGLVSCTLKALQSARERGGDFPPPVKKREGRYGADLWWADALRQWEARRPRRRVQERRAAERPVVYHLVHGGPEAVLAGRAGQVKIGWTSSIESRLGQLTMRPEDVVHLIPCRTAAEAKAKEAELHDLFGTRPHNYRVHRNDPTSEWFRVEGRLADYLRPLAAAQLERQEAAS